MVLAVASVLVLAGCSEQEQKTPTGPEMKVTPPPSTACDFAVVKGLINTYFPPPDQQTAQGYETQMEAGTDVILNGFKIMDMIGQRSRTASPPSPTVGSDLTKALTKCMFDASQPPYVVTTGAGSYNILDSARFDIALNPAAGGVYYVVGAGGTGFTAPPTVLKSKVGGTRLSAATAGPDTVAGTWTTLLDTTANAFEGKRALVYAYPINTALNALKYEWATIDPATAFKPYAFVSLCDGSSDSTLMVHESGVGVLAYSTINLCTGPDATGTATGFRSNFLNTPVTTVTARWTAAVPKSPIKVGPTNVYTFIARATTLVNGVEQGVNNVCLTVTGSNNNGTLTDIVPDATITPCVDPRPNSQVSAITKTDKDPTTNVSGAGYATFKFYATKTGGLNLSLAGQDVIGRDGQTFVNPLPLKYVVNPTK
jgi:hypothetical protein